MIKRPLILHCHAVTHYSTHIILTTLPMPDQCRKSEHGNVHLETKKIEANCFFNLKLKI